MSTAPPPPHPTGVGDSYAPHCDQGVLHAPGECEYCDRYPAWQRYREVAGIAFTGHDPDGWQVACPAEQRRGRENAQAWPGNRPRPA